MNNNKLTKKYGLFTAICMVAGIVIGSGVFFKATDVFKNNGGDMVKSLLTVLLVGSLMTICAYTFSILAGKHSNVNGVVDYAEATCGKAHAYTIGWFMSAVYYPAIASTLAWVSALYTCFLFEIDLTSPIRTIITVAYMLGGFALNILAPKLSGKFQVSTTVIKLIPLAIMAIVGTVVGLINGQTIENLTADTSAVAATVSGSTGFFGAIVAFAFAYEGWIIATCINAELHEPKKNLPKALIIGTVLVITVYLTYFIGIGSMLSAKEIIDAGSNLPKIAFTKLFGGNAVFGTIAYSLIIVSCLGTMNGVILATCRGFYSLAARNQGPAPKVIEKVNQKFNMPMLSSVIGLLLSGAWLLHRELDFFGKLPEILSYGNDELPIIALYALYIPIFINMMIKSKELHPVKRFVFPSLSILACCFMIYCAFASYQLDAIYFILLLSLIMIVGMMFYRDKKGKSLIYRLFYK